jgi:hypothetical protein
MSLNREALLAAAKAPLPIEKVTVDGLGEVYVKGLSGKERDVWEGSLLVGSGKRQRVDHANLRAKLVVRCIVDADGNRLLKDDDVETIGEMRADQLAPLYDKAAELSGLSEKDMDALKKSLEMVAGSASLSS